MSNLRVFQSPNAGINELCFMNDEAYDEIMLSPLSIFTIGKVLTKHGVTWKVTTLQSEPYQLIADCGTNLTDYCREDLLLWLGY